MQKMEQMELQTRVIELQARARDAETETLWKELQEVKSKNKSKSFMQTWENNSTPETHDPMASNTCASHFCRETTNIKNMQT